MLNLPDVALIAAGAIGCAVAVIHAVLVHRFIAAPVSRLMATEQRFPRRTIRMVASLLQFSTFAWVLGGLALIYVAVFGGVQARWTAGLLTAALYLYGAVGNAWASRGRHPGWILMVIATLLIGYGLVSG